MKTIFLSAFVVLAASIGSSSAAPQIKKPINNRALMASWDRTLIKRGYQPVGRVLYKRQNSTTPGNGNNDNDDDQETIQEGVRGLQKMITAAMTVVTQNGCANDCDLFMSLVRCATEGQEATCACSSQALERGRACEACIDDFEETLPQDQRTPYNDLDDAYEDYEDMCELLETRPSLAPTLSQTSSAAPSATNSAGAIASNDDTAPSGSNTAPPAAATTAPSSGASKILSGASLVLAGVAAAALLV
ncbi:hypothetical protein OIO90_001195 [Microbotryomycetes sp. JL221]|nr:hypothetical protein OIO90_001195 [Microbotryomycetes sp. JL221]